MIQLRVSLTPEKQILQIAELLIKERYAIDLNPLPNHKRLSLENGKVVSYDLFLLTGKTKGLLFTNIDKLLNEKYPTGLPEIYSLPIMHMDWEQSKQLTEDIKAVQFNPSLDQLHLQWHYHTKLLLTHVVTACFY